MACVYERKRGVGNMNKEFIKWLRKKQNKEKISFFMNLLQFQEVRTFEEKISYYTKMVMADTRIKIIDKIIIGLQSLPVVQLVAVGIKNKKAFEKYYNMLQMKING